MLNKYIDYLDYIDYKLGNMFNEQSTYIKCKQGCAYCCKEGIYPTSELEYTYLMSYFSLLNENIKNIVNKKISFLLSKKISSYYECPFLINNICSVYPARPIICRTFGLIYYNRNKKNKIPFCVSLGLNYADIYDETTSLLTKNINNKTEPIAYNIDRTVLRSKKVEESFNIHFGEDKSLLEWLKQDF